MDEFTWEYAIFREDGTVDMEGNPRTVRIVNTSFYSMAQVNHALKSVPSLTKYPVTIARRKITSWEPVT